SQQNQLTFIAFFLKALTQGTGSTASCGTSYASAAHVTIIHWHPSTATRLFHPAAAQLYVFCRSTDPCCGHPAADWDPVEQDLGTGRGTGVGAVPTAG